MRHMDYDWDLSSQGIILDQELNTDRLGWRHGDLFKFINVNGKQQLVRIDPLLAMIETYEKDQQSE